MGHDGTPRSCALAPVQFGRRDHRMPLAGKPRIGFAGASKRQFMERFQYRYFSQCRFLVPQLPAFAAELATVLARSDGSNGKLKIDSFERSTVMSTTLADYG